LHLFSFRPLIQCKLLLYYYTNNRTNPSNLLEPFSSFLFFAFSSVVISRVVDKLSTGFRAEFARGDGRVKKKEDERRKKIAPSDTLFVVNFDERTTRREDLQMLFEPYGELIRIDMKRNYAFVQFKSIDVATKAKEATNGGKLDQSVLTVEYVARQRSGDGGRDRPRSRGRDRDRDRGRRGDYRGGGPYPPPPSHRYPPPPAYGGGGGYGPPPPVPPPRYYDRAAGGGRYRDDYYDDRRSRSPGYYRDRPRSRSRSRSPPARDRYSSRDYRDRSPPRDRDRGGRYSDDDRYADRGRGGGGGGGRDRSPSPYSRDRSTSRDRNGGGGRDASYRRDRDDRESDRGYRA